MGNGPLISVVIPTYRRAFLVRSAIESARKQTYSNIEILIVDDASDDNTRFVVESIGDTRIRYLRHRVNRGVSAARNTGIQEAKGAYIAFLDDDDEWQEDKLVKQVQAIKQWDAVLCMGIANGYPLRVHDRAEIDLDDLRQGSFSPSGFLAKAYIFHEIMFDENLKQGEDWDLLIRIRRRYSIGWVGEPLLIYNEGSHARATNAAKEFRAHDLGRRAEAIYKHREFFGGSWFKHHLADTLLTYIGSRPNKLSCIVYAVGQCGVRAVISVLIARAQLHLQRQRWARRERRLQLAQGSRVERQGA